MSTAERVRALLITPNGELLTIKRILPGQEPYWVLPGGGVDPADASREAALERELREELVGEANVHSLLHVMERPGERQFFYLARARNWSFADRRGPEFADSSRGQYELQAVPLTVEALTAIDLKPDQVSHILLGHLRAGADLFSLPDLRTAAPDQRLTAASSGAARGPSGTILRSPLVRNPSYIGVLSRPGRGSHRPSGGPPVRRL